MLKPSSKSKTLISKLLFYISFERNEEMMQKNSIITVRGEESNKQSNILKLQMASKYTYIYIYIIIIIIVKDVDCQGNLFFEILRCRTSGDWVPFFQSTFQKYERYTFCRWPEFSLNMDALTRGDDQKPIKFLLKKWYNIYIYIYRNKQGHEEIGSTTLTMEQLKELRNEPELRNREIRISFMGSYLGSFVYEQIELALHYTFLDYVFGGCDLMLILAIDFSFANLKMYNDPTISSEEKRVHPLHSMKNENEKNEFIRAISAVGSVLQHYDSDNRIPALGFGAKLPPFYDSVSHCFALNGNIFAPENTGLDKVLYKYDQIINKHKIICSGPSKFAMVVNFICDMAAEKKVTQEEYNNQK